MRPERRRKLIRYLEWTYRVGERRGCAVLRFDRSLHRYRAIRNDQAMLRGLGGTAEVERDLTQVSPLVERARDELRLWREHYNERRPRTSLGYVPPSVLLNRRRGTPAYQLGLLTPNSD